MIPETEKSTPRRSLGPSRTAAARAAAALLALIALAVPAPGPARAAAPPSARGPIATVGDRTVDALDIQSAALVLGQDPLRKTNPALWRRMLLDRCVDRELLAMEAEKRGIGRDPAIRQRIAEREYAALFQAVYQRVLVPTLDVTPAQMDSLQKTGLYRMVDLYYILLRDDAAQGRRKEAETIVERLRAGGRFDSVAVTKSGHPSRGNGGHFGAVLARDLDPSSYAASRTAKPGDILGPYSGPYGHEIYKVGGFQTLSPDSIRAIVRVERTRNVIRDYQARLLAQYHFLLEPEVVRPILFAMASETPDSLLASMRPDGTRPRMGARPEIGVIARVDGDSLTLPDLLRETHPAPGANGRIRIRDGDALRDLASEALFRRLLVRDAKERGLASDPRVARELRLIREGTAVTAMIAAERPADPGTPELRAWFEAHAARYRRPAARRARVAVFASQDSAMAALRSWNGVGISDSSLQALRFEEQPRATESTLYPQHAATLPFFDADSDPLGIAVRHLDPGMTSPVVRTAQGYAIAHVLAREPARPMTLDEAIDRVRRDWREEKENEWVLSQLERMRAQTPVRVVPSRLQAVKLSPAPAATGSLGAVAGNEGGR
ncbi:MAG TPA: peptidyl-prolyl cis-trans isomerase [Candidatus Eisenbacteria bacterium]|nr:peptidyl-prolyl cis-trans isomerase [Candidatus Eisenbacteria bacterium]